MVVEQGTLKLSPLSPTIGAVVEGFNLADEMTEQQHADLRRAMLDWKALFFRDQDITTEDHLTFARKFGELEIHPFSSHKPDYPEVLTLTKGEGKVGTENIWHSDVTWRQQPSLGSVLRLVEVPEVGGDTLFSDMYAAYEGLPEPVKDEIEGKVAVHDFPGFRAQLRRDGRSKEEIDAFLEEYPNPEHPVVRTHPETGRKAIYVNAAFTQRIVGMDPERSRELLKQLYRQAATPEYQCRFRWEKNSLAFWDNRACQHYAVSDYYPGVRRAERVTIIGDTPYYDPDQVAEEIPEYPFRGIVTYRANGLLEHIGL